MVPLSVLGVCLESPHAQACTRAGCAHDLHARDGVERLCQQMAGFWAQFAEGSGCRLLGCVVWSTVRLAATCLVMRQLVRRENASPDPDLAGACTACSCGGRCLRRARAPRARRGQLQRVCDGRGMYCGRSGGGRVLVGAIYSDFTVAQNSFAFLPYWRCNASAVDPLRILRGPLQLLAAVCITDRL